MNISRNYKKYVAGGTALALAMGSIGIHAWTGEACQAEPGNPAAAQVVETRRGNVGLSEADKKNLSKDETVYVIAAADGGTQDIIVSDWIKNAMNTSSISDETELTDIVNVKGTENFSKKGNTLGVWDAQGNDIYYQGSIEKELPVDMKVEYTLNGNRISPEDLAGKSGHVVMRFTYANNQKQKVLVGDQEKEMYVPFVALTTMMLDNGKFQNVEVSNGKVINDGEHLMVVGYAMPGMQENLEVDKEDLDIPDYVEISGDVSDFQLAATLTMVSNSIFNELDLDKTDSMDELSDDLDELQDAMNELMDGCDELYDGITELYDKSGDLKEGTEKLYDGAVELSDGARDLKEGEGTLKAGAIELNKGLETLNSNNDALIAGAKAEFEGLLKLATMQLKAAAVQLQPLLGSLPADQQQKLAALLSTDLTIENYDAVLTALLKALPQTTSASGSRAAAQNQMNVQVEIDRAQIERAVEQIMKEKIRQELTDAETTGEKVPSSGTTAGVPAAGDSGAAEDAGDTGDSQAPEQPDEAGSTDTTGAAEASGDKDGAGTTGESGTASGAVDATKTESAPENTGAQTQDNGTEGAASGGAGNEVAALMRNGTDGRATVVANDRFSLVAEGNVTEEEELYEAVEEVFASPEMQQEFLNQVNAVEALVTYDAAGASAAAGGAAGPAEQLGQLKALLDGYNQLYQNLLKYTAGVSSASAGSRQLADGSRELSDGAAKLYDGTKELKDGGSELRDGGTKLIDGVLKLKDGGLELSDGAKEFNEEGIQKLVDVFEDDIEGLMDRMDAMKEVSSGYRSFAGISDDMEGSVKFIYKTEGIETE